MSFISAYHDRQRGKVLVWDKPPGSAQRRLREHSAPYYFYVPDESGEHTSITGVKLRKVVCTSKFDHENRCKDHRVRYESDVPPLDRLLMDLYSKERPPELTVGIIDIEVDYDPNIGFATTDTAYAPINAVTIYRSDLKRYFTLAVPPKSWRGELPPDMSVDDGWFVVGDERELLSTFLDLIDECDVLTGWNSEFFDLPYLGKRIELLFGASGLRRLGFSGGPSPYWGELERFKHSEEKDLVLNLVSRVHLDYLRLFKKFNLEGRQSYALGAIGEDTVDEPKLEYEGSLNQLYNQDFPKFCRYNRHDTAIIVKIDAKFKYVQLANEMVHEATVNFGAIFGSVQLIDTAIMNFAHNQLGKIVSDKEHVPKEVVEGALVLTPQVGLHEWIGSCDINSLYPSTYRALNLSPEKIVGQLTRFEEDWRAVYEASSRPELPGLLDKKVTLRLEGNDDPDADLVLTVGELTDLIRDKKFALSAYGTVLDQSSGEGLLPAVLSYWFKTRKELQAQAKGHAKAAESLLDQLGVKVSAVVN